jgi:hypothetical protein
MRAQLSTDPTRPPTEQADTFGDAVFTYLVSTNQTEVCLLGGEWSNALSNAYTANQVGMLFRSIKTKGHERITAASVFKNHKRYWCVTTKSEDMKDDRIESTRTEKTSQA